MKKLFSFFLLFLSLAFKVDAQPKTAVVKEKAPKLIVGLVIDQMRWDYLYRFNSRFTETGFKRLMKEGFNYEQTYIPYVPTYTAVGHTTIYTGGVPATHGIVGNNWYERTTGKNMYCTSDSTVQSVGGSGYAGQMSPKNMWGTSVADELRLATNFKSKVIGISLKDRGGILPAGHSANAAYWFDDSEGKWISSTYYMKNLPDWVQKYNAKKEPDNYMGKTWETLYPINSYTNSTADDNNYESGIPGIKTVTFPYQLATVVKNKYNSFRYTPYAMTFSFDFAEAAIEAEQLGKNTVADFLALSISSTDYIGHEFGPNSIEVEDTYLRLDKDISNFLQYLDKTVGKGNYLFFLSADHAAAHVPAFLNDNKIPGGNYSEKGMMTEVNKLAQDKFGIKNVITTAMNYQWYLNEDAILNSGKDADEIKTFLMTWLRKQPFITTVYETKNLNEATIPERVKMMLANGYNAQRSGDIQFIAKPGYFYGSGKGTTHGSWNPYDAHIPLLFFGWSVKPGKSYREVYMTDIAPTIAAKLNIQTPNASVGKVLTEVME